VKFIIGPVGSPPVLGVVAVTNPAKVLVLSNGYSPKILTPESKYNFRVQIPTDEFAPSVARWLRTTYPQAKRVGIISPNDAVGQTLAPLHVQAYNASSFDVVFDEKYDRGLKDFGPLLTRMMARGADILELDGNAPGEAGLMIKQARQLGFKGVIIQTGGPGLEEIIRVAGPFAEGFLSYDLFDPSDPAMQGYVKGYRAKYQGPIPGISVMYYNGLYRDLGRRARLRRDEQTRTIGPRRASRFWPARMCRTIGGAGYPRCLYRGQCGADAPRHGGDLSAA
jgi:branched-chain amino acid transport system substrate-binding protein